MDKMIITQTFTMARWQIVVKKPELLLFVCLLVCLLACSSCLFAITVGDFFFFFFFFFFEGGRGGLRWQKLMAFCVSVFCRLKKHKKGIKLMG